MISPQNTLCPEPSHIRKSDIGVIEATSKDPKLDISCQLQFSHRLEAGGWLGAGCYCLTLEALPKTRPKKAGGWQRRHGTGPDKQDTTNQTQREAASDGGRRPIDHCS